MHPCSFAPESILKKRKAREELRAKALASRAEEKKAAKTRRAGMLKRAEAYVKEYTAAEKELVAARRAARSSGDFFVDPEAKLAFVVRIRGINGVSPKTRKILQLLRLRQINNGAFVRLNKATLQMLTLVAPYVAWGYPNLKSIRELVYKRGFAKLNKQRVAITDNSIVEAALGEHGIVVRLRGLGGRRRPCHPSWRRPLTPLPSSSSHPFPLQCVEDLIHEIFTVGPKFKEANNFLWPFKLSNAVGGMERKLSHFIEGGQAGNREHKINALVQRML